MFTASQRGFTLIETLVAAGILVTALAGLSQLFVLSLQLTRHANVAGAALTAAQDKLEVLSGLAFGYDEGGSATTDALLQISPDSSLDGNVEPYVDWVDAGGRARTAPTQSVFVRRWRIRTVNASASPDAISIEVCVFRVPAESLSARGAETCLSTIRTRQP